jgi:Glycosyl transferases group 1
MKIVAHISSKIHQESILYRLLIDVCNKNNQIEILLFAEEAIEPVVNNLSFTKITLKPNRKLGMFIWTHYTLPALIRKSKPSIFINEYGYSNSAIGLDNYLFFSNVDFTKSNLYTSKKSLQKALHTCKRIFVTELFIKNLLETSYKVPPEKIVTTYYELQNNNCLLGNEEKETIKNEYSEGVDYFLFEIDEQSSAHLMIVLKAFSQFKKWQKSSIKLLFLVEHDNATSLINNFQNYKYKEEVFFVNRNKTDYKNIVAASFLMLYFSAYKPNSIAFCAMQNNIPIVAVDNEINRSLFAEAVLYAAATDASVAAQIQFLYKDEYANKALQLEAIELLKIYNSKKGQELFYEEISTK